MPVRKRAVPDDDDTRDTSSPGSPPPATTSHKRARVAPNGHSRTRTDPNDGSDDDGGGDRDHGDVDIQDETIEERAEKDRQFEEANYDKIMASVKSRERYSGVRRFQQLTLFIHSYKKKTIAESGIIERVELFQFMCHQRLTFSFGPQINFIIGNSPLLFTGPFFSDRVPGHNGSKCFSFIEHPCSTSNSLYRW